MFDFLYAPMRWFLAIHSYHNISTKSIQTLLRNGMSNPISKHFTKLDITDVQEDRRAHHTRQEAEAAHQAEARMARNNC
ncbi:hypothetical protein EAF04_002022 [Stromatinia cepivora]|nr:hypothetical protein EAF04_002022 [Stromatinia cepivora]